MVTSVPSSSKTGHFLHVKAGDLARDSWSFCVLIQYQSKQNAIGTATAMGILGD